MRVIEALSSVKVLIAVAAAALASCATGRLGARGPCARGTEAFALALGPDGDLYIAEPVGRRVRRFAMRTGALTTVAGTGVPGDAGEGLRATAAPLCGPRSVALDRAGHLYIADGLTRRVRRVDAGTGIVTTVDVASAVGGPVDCETSSRAPVETVLAVAIDEEGALLVRSRRGLARVDPRTGGVTEVHGDLRTGGATEVEGDPRTGGATEPEVDLPGEAEAGAAVAAARAALGDVFVRHAIVGPDGTLYVAADERGVLRVEPGATRATTLVPAGARCTR